MKAKCPHCCNQEVPGCSKCKDGFIEVGFAVGNVFTRRCLDEKCGFENGGRIVKADIPPEASGPCVMCKGPTEWLKIGEMPEADEAIS